MSPKKKYEGLYETDQLDNLCTLSKQTGFSQNEILRQALDFFYKYKDYMPGGEFNQDGTTIREAIQRHVDSVCI